MSATADIAVHGGRRAPRRGPAVSHSGLVSAGEIERPLVRLLTFSALALYGVLRWATLLSPSPGWRLAGLLALAVAVAGLGPKVAQLSRMLAIAAGFCSLIAMLMIAGIPGGWLLHLRIAVISDGIGQGLAGLPVVLLPYIQFNESIRLVIVLGAGVLLLDAALLIAFAPRALGDLRRIGAALPLVALAVVPSTLMRPQLPYVQGLILFALIAAFMWSEHTTPHRAAGAIALAGVAGVVAVILAPGIDQRHPWINPRGLGASLQPKTVDTFDWSQTYGPLDWPQRGREVLDVKAAHGDYWKTENLDVFNGDSWIQGAGVSGLQLPAPAAGAANRWSQTVQVTIRAMKTTDVIAAGFASAPVHISEGVAPGVSPGTWTTGAPLVPGDSYTFSSYSPSPSETQLQAFGPDYLSNIQVPDISDELTIALPPTDLTVGRPPQVQFAPFHSGRPPQNVIGPYSISGQQLIAGSPYARAYALATQLASRAATPYAFVQSVESYLSLASGFSYNQDPAFTPYPLESFLFKTKRGYCQQFAGAMALLLRMGGMPARVATGFTTGSYDSTTKQFVITDLDAHAWVEVWFPYYGWVRFDPTPPISSPITGTSSLLAKQGLSKNGQTKGLGRRGSSAAGASPAGGMHGGGSPILIALSALAIAFGLGMMLIRRVRLRPAPSAEQLVSELERALLRCGRPIEDATTLAALERRFHSAPAAESYVRLLRRARFAGEEHLPNLSERRALRSQLAEGLGLGGWLRAWWALPPRAGSRAGPRGQLH